MVLVLPSTAEHVKFSGNQPRPLGKAKYSLMTDSERVPRGKGEKHPGEGSERGPETVCLQAVEAQCRKAVRQRTFCIMGLRVTLRGEAKPVGGAVGKPSPHRATSRGT